MSNVIVYILISAPFLKMGTSRWGFYYIEYNVFQVICILYQPFICMQQQADERAQKLKAELEKKRREAYELEQQRIKAKLVRNIMYTIVYLQL